MMREYEECYIAHLDILGFKQLITNNSSCEKIAEIFDEINTQYDITENKQVLVPHDSMRYKVMSDSIVIFISASIPDALAALIHTCAYFQVRMLRFSPPVLIRGAIVKGKIYSEGDVLFGQGLIDAYLIQENYVKYPRVILPMELIDTLSDSQCIKDLFVIGLLFKDYDYVYCIDYLKMFYGFSHPKGTDKELALHISIMLNKCFDESVREKYLYLQSRFLMYYNEENQTCQNNQQQ